MVRNIFSPNCISKTKSKSPIFVFISFSLLCLAGCGGGGGEDPTQASLRGTGVGANGQPAANAPFQVIDLERPADQQQIATGITDGNGNYDLTVSVSQILAVIISGNTRVAGLISPESKKSGILEIRKDFDPATDIACEAGITSVADQSVPASDFDDQRISILEQTAALLVAQGGINLFSPTSVSSAAALVRQLTDNGEHLPLE